eukprot:11191720-Lingulodinium_polyedra.AAC.1
MGGPSAKAPPHRPAAAQGRGPPPSAGLPYTPPGPAPGSGHTFQPRPGLERPGGLASPGRRRPGLRPA